MTTLGEHKGVQASILECFAVIGLTFVFGQEHEQYSIYFEMGILR